MTRDSGNRWRYEEGDKNKILQKELLAPPWVTRGGFYKGKRMFCHDVEEVFWGHKVSDSQKVQEATAFRKKKGIEEVSAERLSCTTIRASASNILKVFDKYLERK